MLKITTIREERPAQGGSKYLLLQPSSAGHHASRRKRRRWRWLRAEFAHRWCTSRRWYTATAIAAASFRVSSGSRVKRAFRRMWVMGATAGPRCIGLMPPISLGWRLRRVMREPGTTREDKDKTLRIIDQMPCSTDRAIAGSPNVAVEGAASSTHCNEVNCSRQYW